MKSFQLFTEKESAAIAGACARMHGFVERMVAWLAERGADDPVYRAAVEAEKALHRLRIQTMCICSSGPKSGRRAKKVCRGQNRLFDNPLR